MWLKRGRNCRQKVGAMSKSGEKHSSNHGKKMEVDGESSNDAVVKEEVLEAEPVGGGKLKELSEEGERKSEDEKVLEAEEYMGGEMETREEDNRCKRRVGIGKCKKTVKNGEEFCLKLKQLLNRSKRIESNGKSSKVKNGGKDGVKEEREEKGEGENSCVEEEGKEAKGRWERK